MKDLQVPCIVCGNYITWDDSPLPAACATHTYQEVFEAYDSSAEQGSFGDDEFEEVMSQLHPAISGYIRETKTDQRTKRFSAPYTIFGKTRLVEVEVWHKGKIIDSDTWDEEMWIERGEDMYGLSSVEEKRVRVVRREDWLAGEEVKS